MTSKFPSLVVVAELAEQLRRRGIELDLHWAPRDQNEAVDALTNEAFGEFRPENQISVNLEEIEFSVLPEYVVVAEELYKETCAAKEHRREMLKKNPGLRHRHLAKWRAASKKLRETAPWGQ